MRGRLSPPNLIRRKASTWYEQDGGVRLGHDRNLLDQFYPQLAHDIDPKTGLMRLEGEMVFRLACNVPTQVRVRVLFPHDYPFREPQAYDAEGRFPHEADRHFYPSGRCCLWLPPESEWKPLDPDALVGFLDQTFLFFDRQFVYEAQPQTLRVQWPGGERGHGAVGYLEYVCDALGGDEGVVAALTTTLTGGRRAGRNQKCPCGSNRKYKRCHMDQVNTARRTLTPERLTELLDFMRNGN